MTVPLKVGSQWTNELKAEMESILQIRAMTETERESRPSVAEWYAGRSVLVTGASGFLGRVLVEFLLRCCPDIGRVYTVLRPKRGHDPGTRLRRLLDVPLFDRLRAEQPRALAKVVPVAGDMEALALALSDDDRRRVCAEVSVVFHVAASVRFDDPFRKAVLTNLRSTREVVALARAMPQLKSLVHVSTAYCSIDHNPVDEVVYPTELDYNDVIRWAEVLPEDDLRAADFLTSKLQGFQPNTYTWTKAMAERLVEDASESIPAIIARPSIVMPTLCDPMPGWIDNLNGLCGFIVGGHTGVLRVHYGPEPDMTFNTVPVDMAIKCILLSSWANGLGIRLSQSRRGVDVVNVTVGRQLCISYDDLVWVAAAGIQHTIPYPMAVRTPRVMMITSRLMAALYILYFHIIFGLLLDGLARATGAKPRLMDVYRKSSVALFATRQFRKEFIFSMKNQLRLQCMLHPQDQTTLDFISVYKCRDSMESVRIITENSLRGVLLHVLKGDDNVEKNLKHQNRIKWVSRIYNLFWILVASGIMWATWSFWLRARLNLDPVTTSE